MRGGATFDQTGTYRYHLWREWEGSLPPVTFVMLNPSTAGAEADDPTIRRCLGFARAWGYGRLEVVNLFGYRATSPRDLFAAQDPEGPGNSRYLRKATAGDVIAAWGNHGRSATQSLRSVIAQPGVQCLGMTALGQPVHPLYVPGDRSRRPFVAGAG